MQFLSLEIEFSCFLLALLCLLEKQALFHACFWFKHDVLGDD